MVKYSATASEIEELLVSMGDDVQRKNLLRFFKTAPGEYGYGDDFIGLRCPQTRGVVKNCGGVSLEEIDKLTCSRWHEVRLAGFLLLCEKMKKLSSKKLIYDNGAIQEREDLAMFYIKRASCAHNWDLVDMSAPKTVGVWLSLPSVSSHDEKKDVLFRLAKSDNLWEQRVSIVSTWMSIRSGVYDYTLELAEFLLNHKHDLMHKAVGWMLREVGKKDKDILEGFLDLHCKRMPRTALRYSIEKFPEDERLYYLKL